MSVVEPLSVLTMHEWDDLVVPEEQRDIELVQGVPVVSPGESLGNRRVCDNVYFELRRACPAGMGPVSELHLSLSGDPRPTVRRPDVMVLAGDAPPEATRIAARHVLLAVEVVSPTSGERDWITKPREYARAGIPAMLVVDPGRPAMALLTGPGLGCYGERTTGDRLTWTSPHGDIELVLADFLA
ncbi:Uma2 family endonuclease [Mobilicoccus caccae]|uniref:Putative restriction endonuclease domain-containing protein n=1 Tax=Mobilicoccus caccae TaxID=1859295 RepID=A0ABQ6IR12_9MICO|nr:Uma2 family endonuclease [Mobilicoccus caccae]GMA39718.1 hypothetical protein GCM10025883_17630 [Mobilicoccus caccae]